MVQISVIRTFDEWLKHGQHWEILRSKADFQVPFLAFSWLTTWWQVFSKRDFWRRDELHILVARDQKQAIIGYLPMFITLFGIGGWKLIRYLRPIGSDPHVTEIRSILCNADHVPQVWEAFYLYLTERKRTSWDFAQWPALRREVMARHFHSPPRRGTRIFDMDSFIVKIPPTWEEFRQGFQRNLREAIRKCYNAPRRDNIELTFIVWDEPNELLKQIEPFFALHYERANSRRGPKHPDYFAKAEHRDFIRAQCQIQSPTMRPMLFGMRHGDELVAARLGFIVGDTIYMYYSGYKEAMGKYSIMLRTQVECFKYCIERGIKWMNLSIEEDLSKTRWRPSRYPLRLGYEASGNLRGWILQYVYFYLLPYTYKIRHRLTKIGGQ